jgi:hypothetical protein
MGRFSHLLVGRVTGVTRPKSPMLPKYCNNIKDVTGETEVTGKKGHPGLKTEGNGTSVFNCPPRKFSRELYVLPVTPVTAVTVLKMKRNSGNKGGEGTCYPCYRPADREKVRRVMYSGDVDAIEWLVTDNPAIAERAAIMEQDGRLDRASANFAALHEFVTGVIDGG